MGWRLGDLGIGLAIISLVLTGFTFVLLEFDNSIGVSTYLTSDLKEINGTLENNSAFIEQSSLQVDNLTSLTIEQQQEIETRSSSEAGVFNLFSKNIAINLIKKVGEKTGLPKTIIFAAIGLITLIVTILVTRFFFGSSRI